MVAFINLASLPRILHKGPQRQGGFNWSSQHLVTEVMRDESRSCGFCQSVVGRCYDPATRGSC